MQLNGRRHGRMAGQNQSKAMTIRQQTKCLTIACMPGSGIRMSPLSRTPWSDACHPATCTRLYNHSKAHRMARQDASINSQACTTSHTGCQGLSNDHPSFSRLATPRQHKHPGGCHPSRLRGGSVQVVHGKQSDSHGVLAAAQSFV